MIQSHIYYFTPGLRYEVPPAMATNGGHATLSNVNWITKVTSILVTTRWETTEDRGCDLPGSKLTSECGPR